VSIHPGLISSSNCCPTAALASGKVVKQKLKIVVGEPEAQATHLGEVNVGFSDHGHSKSYASGAELTSLAHTSAPPSQISGPKSEHCGKPSGLRRQEQPRPGRIRGESPPTPSPSSVPLLSGRPPPLKPPTVGKQVIVQGLEHQLQDAEHQLQAEIAQYQQTEQAAQAAQEAAQQSQQQVSALTAALAASQGGAQHAAKAAAEAAGAAAAQHAMIQEAKQRVAHLSQELHNALAGLQDTENLGSEGRCWAHVAQSNAAAAANAVASSAAESEIAGHDFGGSDGGYHH
jgi:hypothetical protein